jgi:dipeptidyl aminopeptidase/acylaminoacyl peptidase
MGDHAKRPLQGGGRGRRRVTIRPRNSKRRRSAGDEWYFGTPWEHPDVFARNSPSTTSRNAHTPTLIFDGADDRSNPVGQSKGLYRALKHLGVETTMVLYPGEGHSPKLLANNLDMFTRILDWYDGHLKKK